MSGAKAERDENSHERRRDDVRLNAFYATNVYHYDHVISAMHSVFASVVLQRRVEIDPHAVDRLSKIPPLRPLTRVLARRARHENTDADVIRTLGPSQLVFPLLARAHIKPRKFHYELVTRSAAKAVDRAARASDVLQFVEGLGHVALERRSFDLTICERRNFHHNVYEQQIEPIGSFPHNVRADPIGSILDFEYEISDKILVYSNAARASFLERGFSPEKVLVAPIGLGPQLDQIRPPRNPYLIAYVGRGDAYKGLDVAVAAVRALGSPYRLAVAGNMSREMMTWLSLQDHVDYLGNLDRAALRELYSTTACLLSPSVESFGLAILEGVYHGARLICRETTGAQEYLPVGLAHVVVGRDPQAWAAAIEDFVHNDPLTDEERKAAGAIAIGEIGWSRASAILRQTYLDAVSNE